MAENAKIPLIVAQLNVCFKAALVALVLLGRVSPVSAQVVEQRTTETSGSDDWIISIDESRIDSSGGAIFGDDTRRSQPALRGTANGAELPDQQIPIGARAIIRDGDLSQPREPEPQRDGVVNQREPIALEDGRDGAFYDTRPPRDYEPFENPPAGYDRAQFTLPSTSNQFSIPAAGQRVNRLDPTQTQRRQNILEFRDRLFEDRPYEPLGISVGSFQLFPEAEISGRYFSNVFSSPDAEADVALDVLPSLRMTSDWSRHALELSAAGNFTRYAEFADESELGYVVGGRGRLDITSRSNLEAAISRTLAQESRSAINASSAGERIDVVTDEAIIRGNHRFNRLRLRMSADFTRQDFGESGSGANFESNTDRDVKIAEQTLRGSWEFKPTLSLFGEAAINQRWYETASRADGFARDSDGRRYRVGLDFGTTDSYLRGSFSVGYGVQSPDDQRLRDVKGLLVDADLEWRVTNLTSLLFTANSDIFESTTAGSANVITRTGGIGVRHAFRPNLIATAGVLFSHADYVGVPVQERTYITSLDLEYFLTRGVTIFADYDHTRFLSDFAGNDYESDEMRVGVRLSR